MNLSEKSKILVFYLASFFIINQAYSQCTFNILQEADCNGNGTIEIIPDPAWSAPFSYELNLPNGNQDIGTFSSASFQIDNLQGDNSDDYELVMSSGAQSCTLDIQLEEYSLNIGLFIPTINGYAISCNGLCDGEIQTSPQPFPFQPQEIDLFLDSATGTPLFTESLDSSQLPPQQFNFDSLCAGDYVIRYTSSTGCVRDFLQTLYEPDSINITGSVTDVLCSSEPIGAIDVAVSGGVGTTIDSNGDSDGTKPYNYSWAGPGTFTSPIEDISNVGGGSYTLTVEDANACQDSATFFVSDTVPLLTLLLDSLVDISCNSVDDGQIAVSGSGGTGP
ncbi:MAG: hypothetical protein VX344_03155, partial [Bacteroidota bacterium]|nr:hypothetical protein [Bacteroidota bacterium]